MDTLILPHEPAVRLGAFLGVLALMALWEIVAARRAPSQARARRWRANFGIAVADTLVVRFLFPAGAVGVALLAEREGWGLLHRLDLSTGVSLVLAIVVLDLAIYFQHVLFHAVPLLWRLHQVHHTDQDVDATTGIRFHPVEIGLSMGIKFGVVAALGAPPVAVVLFEVILNATSIFNHANIRLPAAIERPLRWIVVTPDMHRIHHSVELDESNSNFGFNLPWWDRLFGTYRGRPRAGHLSMELGVRGLQTREARSLLGILSLPFRRRRDTPANGDRGSGDLRSRGPSAPGRAPRRSPR